MQARKTVDTTDTDGHLTVVNNPNGARLVNVREETEFKAGHGRRGEPDLYDVCCVTSRGGALGSELEPDCQVICSSSRPGNAAARTAAACPTLIDPRSRSSSSARTHRAGKSARCTNARRSILVAHSEGYASKHCRVGCPNRLGLAIGSMTRNRKTC